MPVYKERAFQLNASLLDLAESASLSPLDQPCRFKLALFTTEVPPKALKVNTSGGKIMRGVTSV
jgi:hypothetical protein